MSTGGPHASASDRASAASRSRRLKRPNPLLVLMHRSVLVRALNVRVHNHATERCACEFCRAYRVIVSKEPEPRFTEGGEYVEPA